MASLWQTYGDRANDQKPWLVIAKRSRNVSTVEAETPRAPALGVDEFDDQRFQPLNPPRWWSVHPEEQDQ